MGTDRKQHLQEYLEEGAKFHGHLSPGLAAGILMVDLAQELLGPRELVDAVAETKLCLPDAVQIMTACSCGNGWLVIKNWGKFALTLFDKKSRDGIRVYIDQKKVKNYPTVSQWFFRQSDADNHKVVDAIMAAGRDILSWEPVEVRLPPKQKGPVAVCVSCGETYPADGGVCCARCAGTDNYYQEKAGYPAPSESK